MDHQSLNTDAIFIKNVSQHSSAFLDIIDSLKKWRIWLFLAWQDTKLQYRRSTIGPLWITLSMAITIFFMGMLYSKLFKIDLNTYFPFLASGLLCWGLISSLLNEGTNIFIDSEHFIKQMKQPYLIFVFRIVTRIFIIFFHNSLVLIPIFFFFNLKMTYTFFFLPIGLCLIWINGVSYSTILSILSTRFRDLKPIISSIIQVVFFITPVLWSPKVLPERNAYIVKYNPFAHCIDLLREPFLGNMPTIYTLKIVFAITLIGLVTSFFVFSKYRSRISYWL